MPDNTVVRRRVDMPVKDRTGVAALLGRVPFSQRTPEQQPPHAGVSWLERRQEMLAEVRALNGNQDPGYSGDH